MRKEDLFPDMAPASAPERVRAAVTRIRGLRGQVGHDGLTPSATRTLIDEVTSALEEIAAALEKERDR